MRFFLQRDRIGGLLPSVVSVRGLRNGVRWNVQGGRYPLYLVERYLAGWGLV